jgi:hypothetical protein
MNLQNINLWRAIPSIVGSRGPQGKRSPIYTSHVFELERNLGMFGNLLGPILGSSNILTTKFREFWTLLSQGYHLEIQQIIDNKRYIKPTHLLKYTTTMLQLVLSMQGTFNASATRLFDNDSYHCFKYLCAATSPACAIQISIP